MDNKMVLIVEDNADNRFLYCTILRYGGYEVLEAHHGGEGVALAREYHPDLVLMDLSMPVLDGGQRHRFPPILSPPTFPSLRSQRTSSPRASRSGCVPVALRDA